MELLQWALVAFVVAIIAGMFGFTGIAQGAASVGRVLFDLFLVVAVVFLVLALLGGSILT
jgi:uncharacterized membrane protein YtjA (UPF0391 family)